MKRLFLPFFLFAAIFTVSAQEITVTPLSVPAFTAKVGEQPTCTLTVKTENATDYLFASVSHTKGKAFFINNTMLPKNIEATVVVTFRPATVGEFASTITFATAGATSVVLNLTGTATAAEPEKPDYTTDFVWNTANPYKLLNEHFEDVPHNKSLSLKDWQNVVPVGERPWWGYTHNGLGEEDEHCAKATAYIYQQPNPTGERAEMWLVTPALDYKNAEGKVFTFRVMGDFMFEGHDTQLELYYVDATEGLEVATQSLEVGMPSTEDQNGEWLDYHIDLTGQPVSDVFFMAFRYDGQIGETNAVTYYIDDVSWGRTDLPVIITDSTQIVKVAKPNEALSLGVVTVSPKNLTEEIKLSIAGSNPSNFALSEATLPATGGQFAVAFESDQTGVHEAYIKLSSRGAVDKYIPMAVLCEGTTSGVDTPFMRVSEEVSKLFENGTLYILRNGEKYTIDGRRVR